MGTEILRIFRTRLIPLATNGYPVARTESPAPAGVVCWFCGGFGRSTCQNLHDWPNSRPAAPLVAVNTVNTVYVTATVVLHP